METPIKTRELLERMTDAGEFEILATNVLRAADSRYRNLSHPGVNAQAKPVRSPVDGIGINLQDSVRRLILTAHTTSASRELRGKWLSDNDSDCKKALAIVEKERQRQSFDEAVIVLTTNREPSEELYRDVCAQAVSDVSFDIWTGARLASFLDNDPEGQWLRSQAFSTVPQRLSPSLLKEISRLSVEQNCPPFDTATGIQRAVGGELESFAKVRRGTGFVFGSSGQGKSVACWQLAGLAVERDEPVLFLSDATVERCATIEQALTEELRGITPSLSHECGREALALRAAGAPLLLIVEDGNSARNPEKLIEKLLRWQKPPAQAGDSPPPPNWRLLCPLWPSLATNAEPRTRDEAFRDSINIGAFERTESIAAIQKKAELAGTSLTKVRADKIARALGDDPLLIALTEDFAARTDSTVIKSFIDHHLQEVADTDCLPADLRMALDELMQRIVTQANLAPDWQTIRSWFSDEPETLRSLRKVFAQGRVLRLEKIGETDRLAYRHDRVRDFLLGEALVSLSVSGDLSERTRSDPFFAELFGRVSGQLPESLLDDLCVRNPATIFAALKHLESDAKAVKNFTERALAWIKSDTFGQAAGQQQRYHAIELLAQTDGEFVIDLARRFKDSHWGQVEALLRNGDVKAGVALCKSSDPGVRHGWRDRLIEHAVERFPQIKANLEEYIRQETITDEALYGALNLAGEIADPRFLSTLKDVWLQEPTAERISAAWLWAALMCFDGKDTALLDSLCDVWASLPEKEPRENDRDRSPRWDLAGHDLPFAMARRPYEPAIDYLLAKAETSKELVHPITTIIERVDLPQAVSWIAKEMAAVDLRVEENGGHNIWPMTSDRYWKADDHGARMSEQSKAALKAIWDDRRNEKWLRIRAFGLWNQTMTVDEVADIQRLERDEILADRALRARLLDGDSSAVPLLRQRLSTDENRRDSYWWHLAREVGLDELTDLVASTLCDRRDGKLKTYKDGGTATDHILSELLMDRRDEFSERMLLEHWDHLQTSQEYVLAALYICTPPLLEKARAVIASSAKPEEWFKYLFSRWGDRTVGRPGIVDQAQLVVLQEYVELLDKMALGDLVRACNKLGAVDWRRRHVDPIYFAKAGAEDLWSETGIFQSLDRLAADDISYDTRVHYWLKYRQDEGMWPPDLLSTISRWANDRKSTEATAILCEAMKELGSRRDLAYLENPTLLSTVEAEAAIKNCRYAVRRRTLQ